MNSIDSNAALRELVDFFPPDHAVRVPFERLEAESASLEPETCFQRARELFVLIELRATELDVRADFWRRIVSVAEDLRIPYDPELYDSRYRDRLTRGASDRAARNLN